MKKSGLLLIMMLLSVTSKQSFSCTTFIMSGKYTLDGKPLLFKTDLSANLPEKRDNPEFKFFIDYIPRELTASAILVVGAKNSEQTGDAMMWTILGFPLTV